MIKNNYLCNDDIFNYKYAYEKLIDENFERNYSDDGLIYTDLATVEIQREAVGYLVKSIGANLFKGESVMNISLPVKMFDCRSLLQT